MNDWSTTIDGTDKLFDNIEIVEHVDWKKNK